MIRRTLRAMLRLVPGGQRAMKWSSEMGGNRSLKVAIRRFSSRWHSTIKSTNSEAAMQGPIMGFMRFLHAGREGPPFSALFYTPGGRVTDYAVGFGVVLRIGSKVLKRVFLAS